MPVASPKKLLRALSSICVRFVQLLYGNRKIPRRPYAVGADCGAIQARMPRQRQDDGMRYHLALQPDHIRRTREPAPRSQTETFSACVAGVDSIVVTPFDVTYKRPDAFSGARRPQPAVPAQGREPYGQGGRPAGGSYYVEHLPWLSPARHGSSSSQ